MPMSPMIDVVFLLLIYFIVTYREIIPEAHLAVNLPSGKPTEQEQQVEPLTVEVHPGEYRLNNKTFSLPTIEKMLGRLAEANPELTVIIKVRKSAKTSRLVKLLDTCKGVGLENLNVLTFK